jgi:hypothetical protein
MLVAVLLIDCRKDHEGVCYTTIDQLIAELTRLRDQHGDDARVTTEGGTEVTALIAGSIGDVIMLGDHQQGHRIQMHRSWR